MFVSFTDRIGYRIPLLNIAFVCLFGQSAAAATDGVTAEPANAVATGTVVDVQAPAPDPRREIVCERWSQLPSRIISQRCYVKYTGKDSAEWVDDGLTSLLTREEIERWSEIREQQEQYEERQKELQRIYERCLTLGQC
ncbi:MAG: hypothetical protein IT494_09560 [Gammaproteobacteria bacterium]|nr:hypothetical protein [Gammaproteobacteria bacterium]